MRYQKEFTAPEFSVISDIGIPRQRADHRPAVYHPAVRFFASNELAKRRCDQNGGHKINGAARTDTVGVTWRQCRNCGSEVEDPKHRAKPKRGALRYIIPKRNPNACEGWEE